MSEHLAIGSQLPPFRRLPSVDGKHYAPEDFADKKIVVIVFSCNHCPYVQAYEERMIAFQKLYAERGVQLVAINSNDTKNYPDDDFEGMVKRARERNFPFPYLRDENQDAAGAFGATHTPQFFVFDEKRILRYSGKMDDNWKEPENVKERYLDDAVSSALRGEAVKVAETFSIGCTIKWKT
jgi:peroxiredoxin